MRRNALLAGLALIGACDAATSVSPTQVAGEYELVRAGVQMLPGSSARPTTVGGHLSLSPDARFVETVRYNLCARDACTSGTDTTEGTWEVAHDGSLSFKAAEGPGAAVAWVRGDQLQFWTTPRARGEVSVLLGVFQRE